MSDAFFHEAEEEKAYDPFVDDGLGEGEIGAGAAQPREAGRATSKRKAVFLIGGALAALLVLGTFVVGGDDDSATVATPADTAADGGTMDGVITAPVADSAVVLDDIGVGEDAVQPQAQSAPTEPAQVFDPEDFAFDESDFQDAEVAVGGDAGDPAEAATGDDALDVDVAAPAPAPPVFAEAVPNAAFEEQARRRAEVEAEAARQIALEAQLAEEERLRAPTLIASGSPVTAQAGGVSRFGDAAGPPSAPAAGKGVGASEEITPGTQVQAVLTNTYDSGVGEGRVQARLSSPLRDRNGRILLPTGTRAFGSAGATTPAPGQPPRVNMSFNVFVKPNGDVVREYSAEAVDPQTLASGVSGDVDRHLTERIVRGVAATAADMLLTSQEDDRRTAFEEPSARDMALMDARERVAALIEGPIGDENSLAATVTLEQGTSFVLMFGLP